MERVRRRLKAADDGDRQMVSILTAVLGDGLDVVEAACQQALAENVCSSAVILNILARRRDPAPAVTIITQPAMQWAAAVTCGCLTRPSRSWLSMMRAGIRRR